MAQSRGPSGHSCSCSIRWVRRLRVSAIHSSASASGAPGVFCAASSSHSGSRSAAGPSVAAKTSSDGRVVNALEQRIGFDGAFDFMFQLKARILQELDRQLQLRRQLEALALGELDAVLHRAGYSLNCSPK